MKIVDEKTQIQRSEKMSLFLTTFLVCIPVLGMIIGLFTVVPSLFATVFTKSANRIYDLSVLLFFLALYFIIPITIFLHFKSSLMFLNEWFFMSDTLWLQIAKIGFGFEFFVAVAGQFLITYIGLKRFW